MLEENLYLRLATPSRPLEYPLRAIDIRRKNVNVSFRKDIKDEDIGSWGYRLVYPTDKPKDADVVELGKPELRDDGKYYQTWNTRDYTQQELWNIANEKRQGLLSNGAYYTFKGNIKDTVGVDNDDVTIINNLLVMVELNKDDPDFRVNYRSKSNHTYSMYPDDFKDLAKFIFDTNQLIYLKSWQEKDDPDVDVDVEDIPFIDIDYGPMLINGGIDKFIKRKFIRSQFFGDRVTGNTILSTITLMLPNGQRELETRSLIGVDPRYGHAGTTVYTSLDEKSNVAQYFGGSRGTNANLITLLTPRGEKISETDRLTGSTPRYGLAGVAVTASLDGVFNKSQYFGGWSTVFTNTLTLVHPNGTLDNEIKSLNGTSGRHGLAGVSVYSGTNIDSNKAQYFGGTNTVLTSKLTLINTDGVLFKDEVNLVGATKRDKLAGTSVYNVNDTSNKAQYFGGNGDTDLNVVTSVTANGSIIEEKISVSNTTARSSLNGTTVYSPAEEHQNKSLYFGGRISDNMYVNTITMLNPDNSYYLEYKLPGNYLTSRDMLAGTSV